MFKRIVPIVLIFLLLAGCNPFISAESVQNPEAEKIFTQFINLFYREDPKLFAESLTYFHAADAESKRKLENFQKLIEVKHPTGKTIKIKMQIAVNPSVKADANTYGLVFRTPAEEVKKLDQLRGWSDPNESMPMIATMRKVENAWKVDIKDFGMEYKGDLKALQWKEIEITVEYQPKTQ
jgi:hypothetical protein